MRTLTCVYTINDDAAFADEQARIHQNFKKSEGEPWAITAMSMGHEIHRLSLIEEAHDKGRHDLLDDIFGMVDPSCVASIEDMDGI